MVHISSSSQSIIAALKDVLAYGRLTNDQLCSPPPPPSPTYRPPLYPIPIPIGVVCGCARGCRGGGGEESSSISPLLRNSGAPSALKQIVHKSSYLYSLFHSVIFNSVRFLIEVVWNDFPITPFSILAHWSATLLQVWVI